MPKIKDIQAREILNSQGYPTVEVKVSLDNGLSAQASVPSGNSLGSYEALELRDGDSKRYHGLGVLQVLNKIKEIITPRLIGQEIEAQREIDQILVELDGTEKRDKLGANSLLAVSLACARAGALSRQQELYVYLQDIFVFKNEPSIPVPLFNVFNGGKHADTNLDFQEFLVIPKKDTAAKMVQMGAEIFHELGKVLKEANYDTDTGLEGGYAPDLDSSIEALELILAASVRCGYQPGTNVFLGLDVGSTLLYEEESGQYVFPLDNNHFSSANLIGLYNEWLSKYPMIYLEDALAEDDWPAWRDLTAELGDKMLIVGDDLFATKAERLRRGLQEKAANAIIVKPNQVGTLSETIDCLQLAKRHNYKIIVSHRSGETNDDFIVDLAVASGADYLKAGSLSRGERVAKYNRLLAIASLIEKEA